MTRMAAILMVLVGLVLTIPLGLKTVDSLRSGGLTKTETSTMVKYQIRPGVDLLAGQALTQAANAETVVLEAKNTVTFRGPVLGATVAKAIKEISKISRNIPKSQPIYLVMDTPGGSIMDGADFIDFLQGLPQEVRTITLFSASMGFHIVESNPGRRMITRNGILMSHRAKGGIEGQFDGEMESEYRMFKRKIDYLEVVASARMGLSIDAYKAKIKDELWVHGFDAQNEKVADQMVALRCGESMTGEDAISIQTLFGPITVVFDKCPLIKDPIRVDMGNMAPANQTYVASILNQLLYNKEKFVKEVLDTNKFNQIFQ